MKKIIFIVVLCFSLAIGCSKTGSTDTTPAIPGGTNCNGVDSKFSTIIAPIIANSCATSGCHNAGSFSGPGALTSFTAIKAAASTIKSSVQSGRMPKNSSLTSTQKQAIICWIDSGTLDN